METTTTEGEWILYARERGTNKRFGAVDWRRGTIGVLRIHASHFTDAERATLEANDLAHPNNAWLEWEFRPAPPRMRIRSAPLCSCRTDGAEPCRACGGA